MEDKYKEVLEQYAFEVNAMERIRGAFLLETDEGIRMLKEVSSTENKLEFEHRITELLKKRGFKKTDPFVRNLEEKLVSCNQKGERYVVKEWFRAVECNPRDLRQITEVAGKLGQLHKVLEKTDISAAQLDGDTSVVYSETNQIANCEKHNRELRKMKNYLKSKRQKNLFEQELLEAFEIYFGQAEEALDRLKKSGYQEMAGAALENGSICHGSFSYHNALLADGDIAIVNFEHAHLGLQLMDLYYFMRKVMEKNAWNETFGKSLLEAYHKEKPLKKEELRLLEIMFLYPDKYWKIANHYLNGKKTWIAWKNVEKLRSLTQTEKNKLTFTGKHLRTLYF
ncbi:MAG: CotS family spore coat protein [Lachnospiraceae bacterium]|nr:CotS family spore coat protein [Lachnospiraceae bacterium]